MWKPVSEFQHVTLTLGGQLWEDITPQRRPFNHRSPVLSHSALYGILHREHTRHGGLQNFDLNHRTDDWHYDKDRLTLGSNELADPLQLTTHQCKTSVKSEWADYAAVQVQCRNLSGNELTCNLSGNIRPQSSQLAEPLRIDPGIKEWNQYTRANLHFNKKYLKKAQAANEWSNILPKSSQARKKPPPPV